MQRLLLILFCLFLGLKQVNAEEQGLKITPRHVSAASMIPTSVTTFIFDNLSGSTFHSLATFVSSTEVVDLEIDVSVGFKSGGVYYFAPAPNATDLTATGASPVSTVWPLTLPVAPAVKIEILNNGVGDLIVDHLFLTTS